ncbi:MAG: hypothetical protein K2X71_09425 [Methylobacterium sp.]|uniref:PilZ domain-containing protein n=1 Tax=Methylobacterium sp. TaxID=409 RepID=UPI00258FDC6E|nr:PilZ domain-containing protein [Methylobacterium sp.]MBY0296243.1 hypothetical protein [Methylobacterium sp.]
MSERSQTLRHDVILPALCWNRSRPDFYAVTVDLSAEGLRLRAAVMPYINEELVCSIRHVGLIDAKVTHSMGQDFSVRVLSRRQSPRIVARKLLQLAAQQRPSAEAVRVHHRIVPLRTEVSITLEDGLAVVGRLLNVSASGAGLLGEPLPVGAVVVVGRRPARVVRCFADGVGAVFVTPLDPGEVHEAMVL